MDFRMTKEDFSVEIINKEEVESLFKSWGIFSCECYDTPQKFAQRVGESCFETKHFSGSRCEYIKFRISGVPRSLVDQAIRHEQGVVKNVKSQRYTDSSNMRVYYDGVVIEEDYLSQIWDELVLHIKDVYSKTVEHLQTEKGFTNEQAREVARGVMPMNTESSFVIGFTLEALLNFMNKRLCTCSQDPIRQLAILMKKVVSEVSPSIGRQLVPICISSMYCPEGAKRTCGIRPRKEEVEELIKLGKKIKLEQLQEEKGDK